MTASRARVRVRVQGTVQGVGFRPHVFRLASELGLGGWVLNDSAGVLLEVEADGGEVERFLERLAAEAPPLAVVEEVATETVPVLGEHSFEIRPSAIGGEPSAPVTPDTATCPECLAELFDPADRRHRYPFVNCTNCGPRFSIVIGVPYDRPNTTMAGFAMCALCQAEYDDPADRRFHAQPNACPRCGPSVWLEGIQAEDPIAALAEALADGAVAAIKGIGGFHLACRGDHADAVAALRARKHREDKPFALMAPDLDSARALVEMTAEDEALLTSRARPIVLAPRREAAPVADAVAPLSRDLGVMLPYSPLHHLLLADVAAPLVMTSGNVSDEPIAYESDDALERLAQIADVFLLHDRPIHTRVDDSVARSGFLMRRSRGYVPGALALPVAAREPLLACGAELKNTFCVAKGDQAWVGHHVGDLGNWETLRSFREGIEHFERLFEVRPRLVAHDLHPEYLSTKYAQDRDGVELLGVQHHHAHLAACLAEHGETGPAVGAIFDGTGYGTDGSVWGGELLVGGLEGFERAGHLRQVRMPGGEAAVREPWRMAAAWGAAAGIAPRDEAWEQMAALAQTELAPVTSSMGRLFDAVAALVGVRETINYEGQAAIELEALSDPGEQGAYPFGPDLDPREMLQAIHADLAHGEEPPTVAARFHNSVADATVLACGAVAEAAALDTVVLSGGVWNNARLLERARTGLEEHGLRVLAPRRLPPGDGGISFGQAAIAAVAAL